MLLPIQIYRYVKYSYVTNDASITYQGTSSNEYFKDVFSVVHMSVDIF